MDSTATLQLESERTQLMPRVVRPPHRGLEGMEEGGGVASEERCATRRLNAAPSFEGLRAPGVVSSGPIWVRR